ncbi:MAG TPA: hypothetical protein VM600_09580, partial [Actinomycetota bacterium]|nr:hypothetical protein [Actinomycetota bacterium]
MARHGRRNTRLPRSAVALACFAAACAALAGTARAHPLGQKPVALISPASSGLSLTWIVALDDAKALITSLGLGPIRPASMGEHEAFRAYFLRRVTVHGDARACTGSVIQSAEVANGIAISSTFDCGSKVERARITLTLLQDLSEDYITLYRASLPSRTAQGAFAVGASTVLLDFRPGAEPVATPTTDERRPEGRTARIVAMLQGQTGAASFGFALVLALLLGAFHAITPGHGKTITAAYIVGAGGTTRQALALGGVVATSHAISVAALGGVAVALDRLVLPREMGPWLEVVTGLIVVWLGVSLLRNRPHHHGGPVVADEERAPAHNEPHGHHHLHPEHEHDDHHHAVRTVDAAALPIKRLAAIGLVGGLV